MREPAGGGSPRRYLPVSQPPASGLKAVPEAVLVAQREDRLAIVPDEQRERVLHPLVAGQALEGREFQCLCQLLGGEVRGADRADGAGVDELVERPAASLPAARPGRSRGRGRAGRARAPAGAGWTRAAAGSARRPEAAVGSVGHRVERLGRDHHTVDVPRASCEARRRCTPRCGRRPYASAVSSVVMPMSHAASSNRNASSRGVPLPTCDGDEPMPPKFPQPRTIRDTAIPLRPRARCSIGRSYAAAATRRSG